MCVGGGSKSVWRVCIGGGVSDLAECAFFIQGCGQQRVVCGVTKIPAVAGMQADKAGGEMIPSTNTQRQ